MLLPFYKSFFFFLKNTFVDLHRPPRHIGFDGAAAGDADTAGPL